MAEQDEFRRITDFYHHLTDGMRSAEYDAGWIKGVYPTEKLIRDSISENELFIAVSDDGVVGAMILNHDHADGYEDTRWKTDAKRNEVMVIHALGISQACQRRGIAKQMVAYAIDLSRREGMKAVRLDVLGMNLPAQRLYSALGFSYIGTMKLFYENTGSTDFMLYEIVL
ncbi:MAG: GNAT family N-acetyltransferase [Methanomassiliicoccaceae archaeon]|nr:GNAT family N-acetyltransferase [Methanomassiliicoccaceae archaeon]